MIELCYAVSNCDTGEEVLRDYGKFESVEGFYSYMSFRHGYDSRNYVFSLSGKEVQGAVNECRERQRDLSCSITESYKDIMY